MVQSQRRIWDERVTLVLATPGSLPMDSFNRRLLKAFTIHHPTTFAKLSARYDVKHPSQATGEGRHVRCFRKLIVWRNLGGHFPGVWDSARHILHYYAKDGLPPDGLWKSQEPSVMRVLIESRAADPRHTEGTKCWGRHFFGLQKLLADCNAAGQDVFSRGVGSGSRWKRVECVAHSFGKSFAADLAILNKTDVLVGFHGAGQMNSYFMPQNSSIIEIRGRNGSAKEASFMNLWQPLISTQTNFKVSLETRKEGAMTTYAVATITTAGAIAQGRAP